jgi:hypothetical protein
MWSRGGSYWTGCDVVLGWDSTWQSVPRSQSASNGALVAAAWQGHVALVTAHPSGGLLLLERIAGRYGSWTTIGTSDLTQPTAAFASDGTFHVFARRTSTYEIVHATRSPSTGTWSSFTSMGLVPNDRGAQPVALDWFVAGQERVDVFATGAYYSDTGEVSPYALFRSSPTGWNWTGIQVEPPFALVSRADTAFDMISTTQEGVWHTHWNAGDRTTTALGGPNTAGVPMRVAASASNPYRIDVLVSAAGYGILQNSFTEYGWSGFTAVFPQTCTTGFGVALTVPQGSCAARSEAWAINGKGSLYEDVLAAPPGGNGPLAGMCQ